MSSKNRTKKLYDKYLNKIRGRVELYKKCNKRITSNPEDIFLLGNKCVTVVKHKRRTSSKKHGTVKYRRKPKINKSYKSRSHRGGGLTGIIQNNINSLSASLQEQSQPVSVNPWDGNFSKMSSWR
jgi:hypothetical protein